MSPRTLPTHLLDNANGIYIACIIVDILVNVLPKYRKKQIYRANDTLNSISCGILAGLTKTHARWLLLLPYTYVYKHLALYRAPVDSVWVWLIVLLGVDLAYYCGHKATHVINIGWIAHAAHHSSEDMNFATALRQSMFGHFFFFIFYLPLAFFFPPQLYTTHYAVNMLYQFFIHTEAIGKMHSAIEYIFNTPSHHRVHHARNPQYIDKNFGGMLIIWDRMFGTFAEEVETPLYGLTHQLGTWDVLWAQLHHVVAVANDIVRARGITNKIRIAVAGPGWTLGKDGRTWVSMPVPQIDWKQTKYDPYVPPKVTAYVVAQFVVTAVMASFLFKYIQFLSFGVSMTLTIYIVFCLEVYGLTLNRSTWSQSLEMVRIFATFALSLFVMQLYLSEHMQYYAVCASGVFIGLSFKLFEAIQHDWNFTKADK